MNIEKQAIVNEKDKLNALFQLEKRISLKDLIEVILLDGKVYGKPILNEHSINALIRMLIQIGFEAEANFICNKDIISTTNSTRLNYYLKS